jgi:hypothetical protein
MLACYRSKEDDDEDEDEDDLAVLMAEARARPRDSFAGAADALASSERIKTTSTVHAKNIDSLDANNVSTEGGKGTRGSEGDSTSGEAAQIVSALRHARREHKMTQYEKAIETASLAVQKQVEQAIFSRLVPTYLPVLRSRFSAQSAKLADCYLRLRAQPQSFFGIDVMVGGHPVQWESPIFRLQWLSSMQLPR